ncbi:hypothetical protein [Bacillus pseudomycoides]|uniref:hypothetical protein n=1 Tax=Bacillus pseudomycoides TaxID=64104 RepID=UPI0028527A91|nr:hypothetical protein [Bacillus pseudomycoides]MED0855683.1 hypothetical protein [Bacillus pseudomycoides]
MFIVKFVFQCENCGKENDITEINGTCGNCDNNRLKNFKIIITKGKLKGMGGTQALYTAREILDSALNKEIILIIDPQTDFVSDYSKTIEKLGGKTINLKLENKTSTLNPLEIN